MRDVPAAWEINPQADPEELQDLLERLAEHMGIDTPQIKDQYALLPAHYPDVAQALYEVDPEWKEKGLITPPTP